MPVIPQTKEAVETMMMTMIATTQRPVAMLKMPKFLLQKSKIVKKKILKESRKNKPQIFHQIIWT